MENKTANILITGATAGIGKACAFELARNQFNLILTGRRTERLESLKTQLNQQFPNINIDILTFDVRSEEEVISAVSKINKTGLQIDVLINNAGLAVGSGPIFEGNTDDWNRMIDTNIKGLLYMSRQIAPQMIEQGHGHIINIGSIAGKEVYMNGNVYCGTKHMVDALSKAMRKELAEHNIKVSQVCPGAVETEFSVVRYKGDTDKANQVYNGYENLVAADIADAVGWVITRPERVNINDLVIMPKAQPNAGVIHRNKNL